MMIKMMMMVLAVGMVVVAMMVMRTSTYGCCH